VSSTSGVEKLTWQQLGFGELLARMRSKVLSVAVGTQQPERGARQHRAVQRLATFPESCSFLPREASTQKQGNFKWRILRPSSETHLDYAQ
jgi:hypothetical protein